MAEGRLPKKACQNKREHEEDQEKLDGSYKEDHERKNLNEGQWEDRKQWSLGVAKRRTTF